MRKMVFKQMVHEQHEHMVHKETVPNTSYNGLIKQVNLNTFKLVKVSRGGGKVS